jgi:hypothetical protein
MGYCSVKGGGFIAQRIRIRAPQRSHFNTPTETLFSPHISGAGTPHCFVIALSQRFIVF